jgi:hypothetical protein
LWCIFLCHIKSTQLYINVYWLITLQRQKLKYMTIHETAGCLINTGGLLTQFQVGLTVFVIVYYCFLFIYVYSITVIHLKRPLRFSTFYLSTFQYVSTFRRFSLFPPFDVSVCFFQHCDVLNSVFLHCDVSVRFYFVTFQYVSITSFNTSKGRTY